MSKEITPINKINLDQALEGLVSLGKIALALALIGGITYFGLKKMTTGGKKS